MGGLHHVSEESCHVEILRHQEYVTEVGDGGCLHGDRHLGLGQLFQHKLEYVFHIVQR